MPPTRNTRKQRVVVMRRIKFSGTTYMQQIATAAAAPNISQIVPTAATTTTNIVASTSSMQQICNCQIVTAPTAAIPTRMTRSRAAREIAAIHEKVPIATTSTTMTGAARENATAAINDSILTQCDYLMISETWMNISDPVQLDGLQLISHSNHYSSSNAVANIQQQRRRAAGVAIYKKNNSTLTNCISTQIHCSDRRLIVSNVGDICLAEISINNEVKLVIGTVYFHPNVSQVDKEMMLYSTLMKYSSLTPQINGDFPVDTDVSMLIGGDFNTDITSNTRLAKYMSDTFNLDYIRNDAPTTSDNTTIDLVFARNLNVTLKTY